MDLPEKIKNTLLEDAADRDRTTARRLCLLRILWQERYLIRAGLINRVEAILGKGCFGETAWQDNFYRDMRVVKRALNEAGYELTYSRTQSRSGYYLRNQPSLHPDLVRTLEGSLDEVDRDQIAIYSQLSSGERFQQGCSISDTARDAVAYRIQQRHPDLSLSDIIRFPLEQRSGL
jgi:hypothetical protein